MDWLATTTVTAFLLLVPMLAANQAGMVARWLIFPGAFMPISKRLLGENKTVAPLYFGPALSMIPFYFYGNPRWWYIGGMIGLGAVLGDCVKSLFKRRLGMPPGTPWFFDRIDFALGGCVALKFCYPPVEWSLLGLVVVMAFFVHLVGNWAGFHLGLRKTPH